MPKKKSLASDRQRRNAKARPDDAKQIESQESSKTKTGLLDIIGRDAFGGGFALVYDSAPALNSAEGGIYDLFNDLVPFLTEKIIEGDPSLSREEVKTSSGIAAGRAYDKYFQRFRELFAQGLQGKVQDALTEHYYECGHASRLEIDGTMFPDGQGHLLFSLEVEDRAAAIDALVRANVKNIKRRIRAPRQGGDRRQPWTADQRVNLKQFYDGYQRVCSDAKKIYRKVKGLKTWRRVVRTELKERYPDKNLPDDLLGCLSDLDPYKWPPSFLAIEVAARLSNPKYRAFDLSPRRLKAKLPKRGR